METSAKFIPKKKWSTSPEDALLMGKCFPTFCPKKRHAVARWV